MNQEAHLHHINISIPNSSKQQKQKPPQLKQPKFQPPAVKEVPENFTDSQTEDSLPDKVNLVLPIKQLSHYQRSIEVQRVPSESLTATTTDTNKLASFWQDIIR